MGITEISEARTLAPAEMTGSKWRIKIIEGDRQGSSAYYPKEALESGKDLFSKARSFRNHPSANEKWDQPERRIEDIVGWLSEAIEYDGKDLWADLTVIESERARIKELAEAGVIAISIRAAGEMTEGTNGMELKRFTHVHSVDIVTVAGAGGAFGEVLEADRKQVSASESGAEPLEEKEPIKMDKELEAALSALIETANKTAEAVNTLVEAKNAEDAEKKALEEAAKDKKDEPKGPSATEIAAALVEAELPKAAHAKVIAAVESGTELAEAISAEKKYLETVIEESGKTFAGNGSEELQEAAGSKIGFSLYGV